MSGRRPVTVNDGLVRPTNRFPKDDIQSELEMRRQRFKGNKNAMMSGSDYATIENI